VTRAASRLLLVLVLALAACAPRAPLPPRLTLAPADFDDLAGWRADHVAAALPAFLKSCAVMLAHADAAPVGPDGIAGTVADWRGPCAGAARLDTGDDDAARRFFEAAFRPWRVGNNGDPDGLFTGYFEPELRGAREKFGPYTVPLLRRPPDLVAVDLGLFRPSWRGERTAGRVVGGRLVPYPDRAAIEHGALDRFHLAFLWVTDPVDAFFLAVQGSGRVRLPDGSMVQVGYDGQNGRPYVAIGRLLVERGALAKDDVTLAAIRRWIAAHPAQGAALMDADPAFVFFRERKGEGPLGAEGAVLTAGRSLAVDPTFLPLGAPMWLDVAQNGRALRRLVVAQDTGGAIAGPVRGDLFWGFGPAAEAAAGSMRAAGGYDLLLPRRVVPAQKLVAALR
jgi:peptidoglycan lytic transglycosylase A